MLGVFCVHDNLEVDLENNKMMHCILCYQNRVIRINPKTQVKKGLIFYYKTNEFKKKKQCGCRTHSYCKGLKKK